MANTRPKIILDCDPGLDDAIAILTAAHYCDLVGITTVNGNVGIDHTTNNALLTTQIAGLDVPVHRGAARPLIAPTMDAARIHGETGLGDVKTPDLTRSIASNNAVDFLCESARSIQDLHLIAVGPLTNVALALRQDPDFANNLASITIMGGAARGGNVTAVAEFNVWADPEAAAIIFTEAAPITMVGLDVTHQVLFGIEEAEHLAKVGTEVAIFASQLLEFTYHRCREFGMTGAPIHDATAIICVTHPHLYERSRHPVSVELQGEHTRGMTVTDMRPFLESLEFSDDLPAAHDVVWTADADTVKEHIITAVAAL